MWVSSLVLDAIQIGLQPSSLLSKFITDVSLQRGGRLYTSESDVCRRQILTYKDDPRTPTDYSWIIMVFDFVGCWQAEGA